MGTGYTRNDTANNIADGNVINASDLDGEFDAIQAAFNATTGHSHDGTTGEGPQIGTGGIADLAVTTGKIANDAVTLGTKTSGNYVATGAVSGVGLSGSASAEGATFTVTSNATDANTASTIVARDASGNFSAGTITASLTGTASNAALLDSLDSTQFLRSDASDTKTAGDLSFADNVKAIFGAGSDLQIYHSGTASFISDQGTGNLKILATNFSVFDSTDTTALLYADPTGPLNIYYQGNQKLATTSGGIDVTGTVTADGLTVDASNPTLQLTGGNVSLDFVSHAGTQNAESRIYAPRRNTSDSSSYFFIQTNDATSTRNSLFINGGTNDVSLYDSSGVTQGFYWDASTQRLGLGSTSPSALLTVEDTDAEINVVGTRGTGTTHRIFTGGTNSQNLNVFSGGDFYLNADNQYFRDTSSNVRMTITSGGSVGIGESNPQYKVDVNGPIRLANGNWLGFGTMGVSGANTFIGGTSATNDFYIYTANNERLRINSSGNVGIGVTSLVTGSTRRVLQVSTGADGGQLALSDSTTEAANPRIFATNKSDLKLSSANGASSTISFITGATPAERARIDSSGNLLVSKTSVDESVNGVMSLATGRLYATATSAPPLNLRLNTSDGDIVTFKKDATVIGRIKTVGGNSMAAGSNDVGVKFQHVSPYKAVIPFNPSTNANSDAAIDLGISSVRYKDLYLSGGIYAGSGFGTSGQVLTSNGTTSTWQDPAAGGAGYFLGENGATGDTSNGLGDIFRVHEDTLNTNVTIASGNNALCAGPLTIATGVTLTINGNLSIV